MSAGNYRQLSSTYCTHSYWCWVVETTSTCLYSFSFNSSLHDISIKYLAARCLLLMTLAATDQHWWYCLDQSANCSTVKLCWRHHIIRSLCYLIGFWLRQDTLLINCHFIVVLAVNCDLFIVCKAGLSKHITGMSAVGTDAFLIHFEYTCDHCTLKLQILFKTDLFTLWLQYFSHVSKSAIEMGLSWGIQFHLLVEIILHW